MMRYETAMVRMSPLVSFSSSSSIDRSELKAMSMYSTFSGTEVKFWRRKSHL